MMMIIICVVYCAVILSCFYNCLSIHSCWTSSKYKFSKNSRLLFKTKLYFHNKKYNDDLSSPSTAPSDALQLSSHRSPSSSSSSSLTSSSSSYRSPLLSRSYLHPSLSAASSSRLYSSSTIFETDFLGILSHYHCSSSNIITVSLS